MIVRPLTTNERAETPGFTHIGIVTADDLTQVTAATKQSIILTALKKYDVILRVLGVPFVPFQNTADAAFNSDTVSIGDGSGDAALAAAVEANANGTFGRTLGNTAKLYTVADNLLCVVNSMAAKSLLNLNRGEYHIFFSLNRSDEISNAIARARISKT
jgi:hypothetical protein